MGIVRGFMMDIVQSSSVKKKAIGFTLFLVIFGIAAVEADGQDFIFQFKNPGFGGHPSNYYYFINSAEAQKPEFERDAVDIHRRSPLEDFQRTLQRQLLSQLSRDLTRGDSQIDFTQDGIYDLGDFHIEVISGLDIITIEIRDMLSGERTQVEIPRF